MNKTALVIGANSGIGIETVRSLLQDGCRVWGTYFNNTNALSQLEKEWGHQKLTSTKMDCSDDQSIKTAMNTIISSLKTIDVLVYCVTSPIIYASILKNDWVNFEKHLEIQLKGFLLTVQSLQPQFQLNHKTKIITILSEYCVGKPASGISDYITAKYALMGLSKTLAVELARYHSTVNMISPGMTETELLASLPPKAVEFAAQNNPLKRIAVPKDIASAISFLASDKSDYLNGVNLLINGGGVML